MYWDNLHSTAATSESTAFASAAVFAVTASTKGGASITVTTGHLVLFAVASFGAASRLLVSGGNNFSGQTEVGSEVLDSFVGQVAVVVLPVKGNADECAALERLHEAHDFEIGATLNVGVRGSSTVLLDNNDTLLEEVGIDSDAVGFGDEHLVY